MPTLAYGQGPGHATLILRLRDFTLRHEPATGFSRVTVNATLVDNCIEKRYRRRRRRFVSLRRKRVTNSMEKVSCLRNYAATSGTQNAKNRITNIKHQNKIRFFDVSKIYRVI